MKKHNDIRVKGIVQGVGFRPFIYQIAVLNSMAGYVRNDTEGVFIEAEGEEDALLRFTKEIVSKAPPLSHIMDVSATDGAMKDYKSFIIDKSVHTGERIAFYAPDIALCDDCLREFNDPRDRRYHYPFITCINCGPRFSIINDIPYDRVNTSMSVFPLCESCLREYNDPADRRFHAQPVACPVCGPALSLHGANGELLEGKTEDIAERTVKLLREGNIIAIKGVGGYLLAADATNDGVVQELRNRKRRPFKPFAIMASGMEHVERIAHVSPAERSLLVSRERPIVLLEKKEGAFSKFVAPGIAHIGIMLPYLPFQFHLFSLAPDMVLIMTSGNLSDEPIVYSDETAFRRFKRIADYIITYNRQIVAQNDDSVLFVEKETPLFVRRSRGYVPRPFLSTRTDSRILALGGDLKNSFAIARRDFIILSQYLGDMGDPLTQEAFRQTVDHYIRVFDAEPDVLVSDMHPGYMTTMYRDEMARGHEKHFQVQHHHAHIASVLEDHGIHDKVIGIAYDGTGYGTDGTLWGSEFLIADRKEFIRAGHFSGFPLPGGETAIRDVWKIGLSLLHKRYGRDVPLFTEEMDVFNVMEIMEKGINSPETCSLGRIFDGMSAILGISRSISTEAEAAILLEEAARRGTWPGKPFLIPMSDDEKIVISTMDLTDYVMGLINSGEAVQDIALAFHRSVVHTTIEAAMRLRGRYGINSVALSGGVFHNRIILRHVWEGLIAADFNVLLPVKIPPNDGCIALGQVAVAKELMR